MALVDVDLRKGWALGGKVRGCVKSIISTQMLILGLLQPQCKFLAYTFGMTHTRDAGNPPDETALASN